MTSNERVKRLLAVGHLKEYQAGTLDALSYPSVVLASDFDAMIERLTRERDEKWGGVEKLAHQRNEALAERDRLRELLLEHGQHDYKCDLQDGRGPCNCTWGPIEKELRASETEEGICSK
jgi:hypothetical protein